MGTFVRQMLDSKGSTVHSVSPESMVIDALELMAAKDVGAVLVCSGGDVVGILSERDYARQVILQDRSSRETRVEEIMTRKVLYVTPDHTADDCMALMTDKRIRHLPVMEDARLVGVVSIGDVVSAIMHQKQSTIESLELYIQGSAYH
jgi:CBS domain-containing protein